MPDVHPGWLTKEEAAARLDRTTRTIEQGPQGHEKTPVGQAPIDSTKNRPDAERPCHRILPTHENLPGWP